MSSIQWIRWKAYMALNPIGEERMDIRIASICKEIWNVQLAKSGKPGTTPKYRTISEFLIPFGDAPKPDPPNQPTRNLSSKELWKRLTDTFKRYAKPVKGQ